MQIMHSLSSFNCSLSIFASFGIVDTNIRLYVRLLWGEHEKSCDSRHWLVWFSLCASFKKPRNFPQTGHVGSSCMILWFARVWLPEYGLWIGRLEDPCPVWASFVSVTWLELFDISVVVTCSGVVLISILGKAAAELFSLESRLFPDESFKIELLPSRNACLIISNSSAHSLQVLCGTWGLSKNICDGGETT